MKTQNFGMDSPVMVPISPGSLPSQPPGPPTAALWSLDACRALKNYRENRENGTEQDSPKNPFPTAGFDGLDIKSSDWKSSNEHWPDNQGRLWWKLTLNDGRVMEDFYLTRDEVRGWPDKSDGNRYWFIVHHAPSNTAIEGFSQEPDYEKGFPDSNQNYWYTLRFTDTYCPAIRQWMEKKDRNYCARLEREKILILQEESTSRRKRATHNWMLSETQDVASSSSQVHDPLGITMKPLTTCSITELVMAEPVSTLAGHTYEREAIEAWLKTNDTDPLSGGPLDDKRLIRGQQAMAARDLWFKETPSHWHNPELIYLPKTWQIAMVEEGLKQSNREVMSRYLERHLGLLTLSYSEYQEETLIQLFCRYGHINDVDWLMQQWEKCQKGCTQHLLEKDYFLFGKQVSLYAWGSAHRILIKKLTGLFDKDENRQPDDTLLHYAARNNERSVAEWWLVENSEAIDNNDAANKTALYIAVERSHFDLAEMLVKGGANPATYCDSEDQWLLELAVTNKASSVFIDLLLSHGANPSARDRQGQSVIEKLDAMGESEWASQLRKQTQYQNDVMPRQWWAMQQQIQSLQATVARQQAFIERLLEKVGLPMALSDTTQHIHQEPDLSSSGTISEVDNEMSPKRSSSPQSKFFVKPASEENQGKGKRKSDADATDEDFYEYPKKEG